MNFYQVIIVGALLADAMVNFIADWLNLRRLSADLPIEFRGLHDARSYSRAQEYARVKAVFSRVSSTFSLIVLLLFWWSGGFVWLDRLIESPARPMVVTGVLYIFLLVLGRAGLQLPFRVYDTFVIEQRFGFNRTTPATFCLDLVKSLLLGCLLGLPILALVLFFSGLGRFLVVGLWVDCDHRDYSIDSVSGSSLDYAAVQ